MRYPNRQFGQMQGKDGWITMSGDKPGVIAVIVIGGLASLVITQMGQATKGWPGWAITALVVGLIYFIGKTLDTNK